MVVIIAIHTSHMQRDTSGLCETRKCVWHHLSAQLADFLPLQSEIDHAMRSARDVDDGPRESFVERCVAATKPNEGETKAKGTGKSGPEGKECIFCGVMVVDWWMDVGI